MGYQFSLIFFMWASLLVLCLSFHDTKLSDDHDLGNYSILDSWDEMRVVELFQNWKEKHKRVYRLPEEAEMRFENFKRNVKYILESSKSRKGHQLGLNRFADLSNEEFRKLYLSNVTKPLGGKRRRNNPMRTRLDSCDAPSSLDWRKKGVVTAVKDQGDCGSCWAFSSTGAMEGVNAIVTGDLISLSEQELVDCDSTNYGCDGGYMDYAFEWVINNAGIDSESDYSYTGQDGTCNKAKEERKVVTIDGYEDVGESDRDLLCATIHQPISVGIDGSALDFQLYTGGIYDGDCSDNPNDIDHAVLIVGYGSEGDEDYWIVKNSWGTSWGIQGYFYIKRNTNLPYGVCAINAMASYPTKESSTPSPYPSPSSPPPPSPILPPPPPPPPSPTKCGDFSYCPSDETCCCLYEFYGVCLIYGCCEYENAVCCIGTEYCCPNDYPICDIEEGLCLKNQGDSMGVATKKKKMAKHKFPWAKTEKISQPLELKRNPFATMR
ncbi:hypothetical protein CsatA_026771 [Cannabis sativa]